MRLWIKAYAGDTLRDEQVAKLSDRLSSLAGEWARCAPDEESTLLEKVKAEVLKEFSPPAATDFTASKPLRADLAQARLGHSLVIRGDLSGSESVYIDGRVEGSIVLPGNRVTVGRNAIVAANIHASEIVIFGEVRGNLTADRVDIHHDASLTGDVVAQRISIEDGAFFKGGIDILKSAIAVAKTPQEAERIFAARRAEKVRG